MQTFDRTSLLEWIAWTSKPLAAEFLWTALKTHTTQHFPQHIISLI